MLVYWVSNYKSASYKLGLCDYFSHVVAVMPSVNGLYIPNFLAFPKCTLLTLTSLSRINKNTWSKFFSYFLSLTFNSPIDYHGHLTQTKILT